LHGGTEENHEQPVKIAGVPSEARKGHFMYANLHHYSYDKLLGLCSGYRRIIGSSTKESNPCTLQAHGTVLGLCRSDNMQNTKTLINH